MAMKNPPHPGVIVRTTLVDGLGISVTAAAAGLGVTRKTLSAILNEKAGISPEMAVRLEKGLGSSAETWLRLQSAYELAQVESVARKLKVRRLASA